MPSYKFLALRLMRKLISESIFTTSFTEIDSIISLFGLLQPLSFVIDWVVYDIANYIYRCR